MDGGRARGAAQQRGRRKERDKSVTSGDVERKHML